MKRQWYSVAKVIMVLLMLFVSAHADTKQVSSSNITVSSRALFGIAQSIVKDGNIAFIAADNSVIAMSVSAPSVPSFTSFSYPMDYIQDMATNTDYIFATVGTNGIEVIPKATSSDSSTIKTYGFGTFMGQVTIDKDRSILYVATKDSGIMVLGISGDSLSKIGTITGNFGIPNDLVYSNDTLVIGGHGGIFVYDVSVPENPVSIDSILTKHSVYRVAFRDGVIIYGMNWMDTFQNYYTVAAFDGTLSSSIEWGNDYVADIKVRDSSLFILKREGTLSYYYYNSPTSVSLKDRLSLESMAFDMDVDSNFVYLIEDDGFHIIQYKGGNLTPVSTVYSAITSNELTTFGNYLFSTAGNNGIMIIDMEDTLKPKFVSRIPDINYSMGLSVKDTFLLCASLLGYFSIYNISDPINPMYISGLNINLNPMDIAYKDNIVYIAANYSGLLLIDISNPLNPILSGSINTGHATQKVNVYDNYMIVSDLNNGTYLYNVTIPSSASLLYKFEASLTSVLNDTMLIIAKEDASLGVYNIKDPQNPVLMYNISLPENANSLYLKSNLLYVTCGYSGSRVYQLSGSQAELIGYFITDNRAKCILPITESLFYVAEEEGGLYLLSGNFTKQVESVNEKAQAKFSTIKNNIVSRGIYLSVDAGKRTSYVILDISGRVMRSGNMGSEGFIKTEGLSKGLYYIVIKLNNGERYTDKFIIR